MPLRHVFELETGESCTVRRGNLSDPVNTETSTSILLGGASQVFTTMTSVKHFSNMQPRIKYTLSSRKQRSKRRSLLESVCVLLFGTCKALLNNLVSAISCTEAQVFCTRRSNIFRRTQNSGITVLRNFDRGMPQRPAESRQVIGAEHPKQGKCVAEHMEIDCGGQAAGRQDFLESILVCPGSDWSSRRTRQKEHIIGALT